VRWRSRQARNAPAWTASLPACPAVAIGPELTWPAFWELLQVPLRDRGYRRSSLVVVRQVLRGLARTCGVRPSRVSRDHLDMYFRRLTARRCSASWLAMNISILRTVFDKIHGSAMLEGCRGPKRPDRLPRILSRDDMNMLLNSAEEFREVLLLGLLADCGLKIGEARALRWANILPDTGEIHVASSGSTLTRTVPIPMSLATLLPEGKHRFEDGAHLFPGRRPGIALSARMAERIVRRCTKRAGLPRHVTAMVLRHTCAVQALEDGVNIRQLQTRLGHVSLETTMRYQRCLPPEETVSPLDATTKAATTPPIGDAVGTSDAPPYRSHGSPARRLKDISGWFRKRLGVSSG
jgi:integrase/recombinase XerD